MVMRPVRRRGAALMSRRAVLAIVLAVAVVAAASVVAVLRLRTPLPAPAVHVTAPAQLVLAAGTPPAVPSPTAGGFLLEASDGTELASTAADTPRPIASVAKVMTALVVLQAQPLAAGADGPLLTLTEQDVAFFRDEQAADGSVVPVTAGEALTERQLLLALLLPSANNIADTLAVWVSGGVAAFVARENAAAAALGMTASHFDDASGVSASTVSTPRDLVRLAAAAMAVPALADIVQTQTAALPDGTALHNLDILLAANGDWLGIKTGWTPSAGGCLLFAARHAYTGSAQLLTLYGAALGQSAEASVDADHPELGGAFSAARAGESAAVGGYAALDLATLTPAVRGSVDTAWDEASGVVAHPIHATALARLGQSVSVTLSPKVVGDSLPAGTVVATLNGPGSGKVRLAWPVVTTSDITGPSWWWHLLHG
ncbi:MAG: D-alanyl-D-alanine carboxypeptidase [Candidatus Dormibacteraeota bacterium]|nr:D-alanyl-D-alanine carboxypeptidase [Candidatus Dormibacteraeota bacterium]